MKVPDTKGMGKKNAESNEIFEDPRVLRKVQVGKSLVCFSLRISQQQKKLQKLKNKKFYFLNLH